MVFKNVIQLRKFGVKFISTHSAKKSTETITVTSKRDDYYQSLSDSKQKEGKPPGWDEALPFDQIPGPKPLPIIGNVWRHLPYIGEFYGLPLKELNYVLREKYGDIVLLKGIPAKRPVLMLFNVEDFEMVFRNAGPFPIRRGGVESLVHYRTVTRTDIFKGVGGVLTLQGKEWFDFRSVVNPILMQPKIIQQYVHSMDTVANELVENMRYFSKQNENNEMPENFLKELYKWALESVGVVALDRHLGCLDLNAPKDSGTSKLISSVNESVELMFQLEILPPIWKHIPTPTWKRYEDIQNYITQQLINYIDEAMEKSPPEGTPDNELSVLQRLAKIDKRIAVTMVMDMLMAGIDTTGRTVGAALYFLAKNPDKQQRLREEIFKNLPEKNTPITNEILVKSPYLKSVIKETTRIAPIAIGNGRTTVKDMVIRGYQIPKDTDISTANLLTANSDSEFKEAGKFIPERWLRTTEDDLSYKNAHSFAYLPFGFGPRSCIGKRLANLEIEVALSKIVRNFYLSWNHGDMVFGGIFLYGVDRPLKLTVKQL